MLREIKMELGLKGKVALITGAGSQIGMGKAIAVTLARAGCDVIVSDINLEGAKKTAAEIESIGCKAMAINADVTKNIEVNDMVKKAQEKFGKIDILVNTAGGTWPPKPFPETNEADWDAEINLNLKGALICTRAVIGQMLSRKSGKIVNFSSIAAKIGFPNGEAYCAAKAGIIGFTRSLALEVAPCGINVNCIVPGFVPTAFGGGVPPDIAKKIEEGIPVKRAGTPQDIANLVAFMVSDVSSYITGQTISIDGGQTMT
jgi:3-oxoacyl-[acyl-carrier protein] reductase